MKTRVARSVTTVAGDEGDECCRTTKRKAEPIVSMPCNMLSVNSLAPLL